VQFNAWPNQWVVVEYFHNPIQGIKECYSKEGGVVRNWESFKQCPIFRKSDLPADIRIYEVSRREQLWGTEEIFKKYTVDKRNFNSKVGRNYSCFMPLCRGASRFES
jgi:hypothetical protein